MSKIETVSIDAVNPNPHRHLDTYPFVERKVEALMRSIADVGLWEGVIARKDGNSYQIAFGHHRVEAARRAGLKSIPLVVRDLDDAEMLKFMGRENGEDYNADFLVMLETWEAAEAFLSKSRPHAAGNLEASEIAGFLGWTRASDDTTAKGWRMNHTADACAGSSKLLKGKHITRGDLEDLSVKAVGELVQTITTRLTTLDKAARDHKWDTRQKTEARRAVEKSAVQAIQGVKSGTTAVKDIRREVDVAIARQTIKSKNPQLFDMALDVLTKQVNRMLKDDSAGIKVGEVQKLLADSNVHMNAADTASLDELRSALTNLSRRAARAETGLDRNKVRHLKAVEIDG